jgi:hypothetical protein
MSQKNLIIKSMIEKAHIIVRPYPLAELAFLYGVDKRTLRKWMKPFQAEIGLRIGNFFQVNQVRVIFQRIPLPDNVILYDNPETDEFLKKAR